MHTLSHRDPAGEVSGRTFRSVMKTPWFVRGTVFFSGQGAFSSPCWADTRTLLAGRA